MTRAAPFSPIMMVAALMLVEVMRGMTDASITRSRETPCTRSSGIDHRAVVAAHAAGAAGMEHRAALRRTRTEAGPARTRRCLRQHSRVDQVAERRLPVDVAQHADAVDQRLAVDAPRSGSWPGCAAARAGRPTRCRRVPRDVGPALACRGREAGEAVQRLARLVHRQRHDRELHVGAVVARVPRARRSRPPARRRR